MDIQTVSSSNPWNEARARLRHRYSGLTDEDLVLVQGREEDLLNAVATKTGQSREAVVDVFSSVGLFRG